MNKIKRNKVPLCGAMMGLAVKILCVAAILSLTSSLHAQGFYGTVVGTVTDSSGALVPHATVIVTNLGTTEAVKVQTGADGQYSVVNLVPAKYSVTVEKDGFKRAVQQNVPVEVGATIRINLALAVGNATETVEVTSAAPLLQTDTSSLNSEVEGAEVQEMPLNGRNVMNLLTLAPGVIGDGGTQGSTGLAQQGTRSSSAGWGNYQIGGALQGQSAQFVDGAVNNLLGGNSIALVPTQDAVQEFSVLSSVATADFGRYSGGVVNMTTKSGTNAFHGSIYEYNRNTDYNANTWFNNHNGTGKLEFDQNQYGAGVNGPIKRDKAFFMFTWEGFRVIIGSPETTFVPTVGMQNGVFVGKTIKDPSGACNVQAIPAAGVTVNGVAYTGTGTYIANLYQPAQANTAGITTCGDPTNRVLKNLYPAPDSLSTTAQGYNWYRTVKQTNDQNQYNSRVDYNLSEKQRLFARYSYWNSADGSFSPFGDQGFGGTTYITGQSPTILLTHQAVLGDTYTLNPSTVLDVRVDYTRQTFPDTPVPAGENLDESQFDKYNPNPIFTDLAPQMNLHLYPNTSPTGPDNLFTLSKQSNYNFYWFNNYHLSANVVKILGKHTIKVGADARLMDSSGAVNNNASGSFSYTNAINGDEFASVLLGYPTSITFTTFDKSVGYEYYQAYYVADTWQATKNLTLNLGLRYERPGAIAERNNKMAVLLPNTVDPYTGITGTEALTASSEYAPRGIENAQNTLFAPRLGFAYRATDKTVVHGGYGVSYLPNDLSGTFAQGVLPYASVVNSSPTTVSIATSTPVQMQTPLECLAGITPAAGAPSCLSLGIQKPGFNQPLERNAPNFMTRYGSLTSYLAQKIVAPSPFQAYPTSQQWNLAVSHQFRGDTVVEVGYAGLHGSNLPGIGTTPGAFGLDELSSKYYSLGPTVLAAKTGTMAATAAGFATCPNTPGLAAGAITVGQCLRPYPYYNNFSDSDKNIGYQNYKSVLTTFEKRFKSVGILKANYVWSKNMSDADSELANLERGSGPSTNVVPAVQDYNNLAAEYSLIGFDVKNRFLTDFLLNLPFGKGQKYGDSLGGVASKAISGWSVDGIVTFQSGFPIFLVAATQNNISTNFGGGMTRPSVVPGCDKKVSGSGTTRVLAGAWFNTSCFVYPGTAGTVGAQSYDPTGLVTFGNEPRVDPDLRSDGVKNFDLSLQKSTPIHESVSFVFRAEFFNAFNRVQFDLPNNAQGSSGFGQSTIQVNNPRQIQFSGRVNF